MELLIEKQDQLKIVCKLDCFFSKNQFGYSYETANDFVKGWHLPNAIICSINFNEQTKDVYHSIKDAIDNLIRDGDEIRTKFSHPFHVIEKIKPKSEYLDKIAEITEKNEKIEKRYNELINELKEIGVRCDDGPRFEEIPNEYYELKEYDDYNSAFIEIYCHKDTKFYKFLKENNLIQLNSLYIY